VASNISQDKFFNIQSNPNLDAADTGVDSSGKILSKEERKAIFRRRRINPKKVFGGSGAIVKVDKSPNKTPMGALIKSVSNIQNTVQRITNFIATDAEKEKEQQRQDQRDQFVQDDKDRKKKKEGLLEGIGKSIGKSLLKPVEAVGKNVKGILGRLGDAFMAIFGGFIANKGIKMIQAKMSGDTDTFKKMRNEMIKGLAVVGGIFLALNGGLLALPLIIKGVALAVIKIGAAILAFLASPAGLIALGLAAGVGVLFAMKKGIDAGRNYATGGAAFTEKHDALDQRLKDAGMNIKGQPGKNTSRGFKVKGKRSAEQEKIFQEVQAQRKVLNDTHTKMDAEVKQAQENAEPDSYIMKRVGSKKVRVPVVSQKRKNEIKEEIESKYYNRLRGVTTSPKIDSNPTKNNLSTLNETEPQIIDATTNSGGGNMVSGGNDELATSLPNIPSSNSDNKFTLYSQTQYNMVM